MAGKITFDVGMDNREFMSNSKDIARAINSLKSAVAAAGKSMSSSATGYGNAMRQSINATKEYENRIRAIKTQMDTLKNSADSIKASVVAFETLKEKIKNAAIESERLRNRMRELAEAGQSVATPAWEKNQADIASANAKVQQYTKDLIRAKEMQEKYQKSVSTKQDIFGEPLDASALKDAESFLKIWNNRIVEAEKSLASANEQLGILKSNEADLVRRGENGPSKEYMETDEALNKVNSDLVTMNAQQERMKNSGADKMADVYARQSEKIKELEYALQQMEAVKERALKPPYLQSWEQMTTLSGLISEGMGRIQNAAAGALYAIKHPAEAADRALGTLVVKTGQLLSSFARIAGSAALSFLRNLASTAANAAIQLARIVSNAVISGLSSLANSARNAVVSLARLATNTAASALRGIASAAGSAATSLARLAKTAVTTALHKVASGAAAAGKGILGLFKHNEKANQSFKRSFTTILKYAFGVRSMYFLFRRLRTAVKDAFTELAKYSPEVKSAIQSLQVALNGLKASLASAFAPIFTAVAPALTHLINMLTSAMNTLGAFFAALMGKTSYQKAVGAAKSAATGASKSAKKAKKDVEELKRELLGFDELNVLQGDNNNNSTSGSSEKSSGMSFVTEQIPGGIKGFVDRLKELWNNKDYIEIGKIIADWVNKAVNRAKELIKWENVAQKIQDFVDAVAGIMEGLLTAIDWENIGDTIAEALRTVANTIDTFMKKLPLFMLAGSALAEVINGFFANEQLWKDLATTITDSVKAFLTFGQAFLDGFDEVEAANGIRTAILGIEDKLPEIASAFWELVKTAFTKTGSFIDVLLGGQNKNAVKAAHPDIDVDAYIDVWDELAKTLTNGFNKAVEKLAEFIQTHNPVNAIAAFAAWVIKLKNGINWEGVGKLIGIAFRTALDGLGAFIDEWGADAETLGTQIADAINGFVDTAFSGDEIATNFNNRVKSAFKFLTAFLEELNEENLATELRKAIIGIDWDGIASAAWETFKTAVNNAGNFIDVLLGGRNKRALKAAHPDIDVDAYIDVWDDVAQRLIDGFNTAVGKLTEFINGNQENVTKGVAAIATWIGKVIGGINWDGVGTLIGSMFTTAFSGVGTAIADFATHAEENGRKIFNALSAVIHSIDWFSDSDTSVKSIIKNSFSSAIGLAKGFFGEFNTVKFAGELRKALEGVPWADIAKDIWDFITDELSKLGDVLTVLFGGNVESDMAKRFKTKNKDSIGDTGNNSGLGASLGKTVSGLGTSILGAITYAINNIDWGYIGGQIHDFIVNMNWGDIAAALWNAIVEAAYAFSDLLIAILFGQDAVERMKGPAFEGLEKGGDMADAYAEALSNAIKLSLQQNTGEFYFDAEAHPDIPPEAVEDARRQFEEQFAAHQINVDVLPNYGLNDAAYQNWIIDIDEAIDAAMQSGHFDAQALIDLGIPESAVAEVEKDFVHQWNTLHPTAPVTPELSENAGDDKKMEEAGKDQADGVKSGFESKQDELNQAAKDAADGMNTSFEDEEGIASPSKVFEEYGKLIIDGLMLGLQTLPERLQAIWDALPEWAQTMFASLGKTLGINLNANANGGDSGGAGDATTSKNTKAVKRDIKETQKNTKELKKNTAKRGEVDVNYEGAGFDTSEGKPKLNVGVQFVPEGEEPTDENTNGGLLDWLQELLNADTLEAKIALIRDNWESVVDWMYDNEYIGDALYQLIQLAKQGDWKSVVDWFDKQGFFGPALSQVVELAKQGRWKDVLDWFKQNGYLSENIDQLVDLVKNGDWTGVIDWLKKNKWYGPALEQLVGLVKDGNWTGVIDWLEKSGLLGPALQQLVQLVKDGNWTGVIDWLKKNGLAGPAFEQLIKLVKDNWTTIAKFLGFDPATSQVVEMLLDLLMGKTDPDAQEVLDSDGKEVTIWALLKKLSSSKNPSDFWNTLLEILAKLTGKDTSSLTIGGLFGTILQVAGKLLGTAATGSSTISALFGTLLNVYGKLSGTAATGSSTISTLFGTLLNVFGKLSGTAATGSSTISALFGTLLNVYAALYKKDNNQTPGKVFDVSTPLKFLGNLVKNWTGTAQQALGVTKDDLKTSVSVGVSTIWGALTAAAFLAYIKLSTSNLNTNITVGLAKSDTWTKKGWAGALGVSAWSHNITVSLAKEYWWSKNGWAGALGVNTTWAKSIIVNLAKEYWWSKNGWAYALGTNTTWAKSIIVNLAKEYWWSKNGWAGALGVGTWTQTITVSLTKEYWWSRNGWAGVLGVGTWTQTITVSLAKEYWWYYNGWAGVLGVGTWTQTITVSLAKEYWWNYNGWQRQLGLNDMVATATVKLQAGSPNTITVSAGGSNTWRLRVSELGGIILDSGKQIAFKSGGIIRNGLAKAFSNIPRYASGGLPSHGTMFVAGENGPEIMGHINGRTEILNKSQLADAMYGAVVSGMANAVNALGTYLGNRMSICTNAIIQSIGSGVEYLGMNFYAPAMATGGVMPYDVAMQIARSTQELQNTLDANNEDLIQAMVSAVGNAAQSIVRAMQTQAMRGNTNGKVSTMQMVDDINRMGQMFGQSPIKGV